ncbi:MAG TPA: long-chain fatty acid--CoA ligase [Oligoflexia bacterium]|nr:long-chain fatty acid--CoA ligase [Oligoflexia bacterium]HMP49224.1 long-chain fatty acid--CoA ligase [Oligoflexia bacterium]
MTDQDFLIKANSIPEDFFRRAKFTPLQVFARIRTEFGWVDFTMKDIALRVLSVRSHLLSLELPPHPHIGIISNSRLEWLIADMAILSIGGVSVSLYQSLLPKEIAYILHDAEVSHVFAENEEQVRKIEEVVANSWEIPAVEDRPKVDVRIKIESIITFEEVDSSSIQFTSFESLIERSNEFEDSLEKLDPLCLSSELDRDSLASLVYTSGTTGPAKGVIQTHGNHLSNVRQVLDSGLMIPNASIFLFLPLAHSFARLMGYLASLTDLSVVFSEVADKKSSKLKPAYVLRDMAEANATIFPIVPRFLEKIRDQLLTQSEKSGLRGFLLRLTFNSAEKVYTGSASFLDKITYLFLGAMRSMIRQKLFGANFSYCVSGGAKLPSPVQCFFESLSINIYEGYGLTETVVATNAGTPKRNKVGSVGRVLAPDIEIKIMSDGEICFRGPNISPGYYKRPKATKESWMEDSWFHTGDLGYLDNEGFLYVTGRKKEIIVTSGGKNIAPLPIEEKIMDFPPISQAVVIGDGRKFCSAVVTINKEAMIAKAGENSRNMNFSKPSSCPVAEKVVWDHIKKVNESLSSFETIKKIIVADEEFTVENGLLTPSMKIKRKEVEKRYQAEVDALYD